MQVRQSLTSRERQLFSHGSKYVKVSISQLKVKNNLVMMAGSYDT